MRAIVSRPEDWYRLFWVCWTLGALIAARLWLVNPIVRAQRESADRIVQSLGERGR